MTKSTKPLLAAIVSFSVAGCTAQGGLHPAAAALGCGATGAIVGLATGSAGWGAGAAGGCLAVAWAVSAYQESQSRTAQQDQQLYGYGLSEPVSTTAVKIRKASSTPATIKPGDSVHLVTDYSVIAPSKTETVQVTESLTLKKDGEIIFASEPHETQRTAGGWQVSSEIPIPKDAEPGTYVVVHQVVSGNSNDLFPTTFVVQG
jgi:hypothetical protein